MTTPKPALSVRPAPISGAVEALYKWMQTLAVALVMVLVAATLHIGSAPYIAFAFTGAFFIHLTMRPSRRELMMVLAFGTAFGGSYFLFDRSAINYFGQEAGVPGGFLGMGTVQMLATQWIWAEERGRRARFERVRDAALIPLLCIGSMIAVSVAANLTPITYDRVLYVFDLKFGGPPSWVIGRLFLAHPWLHSACGYIYNSLPLELAACLAIQWRDRHQNRPVKVDLRWLAVALGTVGFVMYQVCPVAGPVYLFGKEFPVRIPDLMGLAIQPAWLSPVPRNGMPSLHLGWTLLLLWNMRDRAWWIRVVTAVYMVLTALATLGSGEHYLMDLIVAAPLALATQAGCTRTRSMEKRIAMLVGAGITIGWLIAFRTGAALAVSAGATVWTLAVLTVAVPVALLYRLGPEGRAS